MMNTQKVTVVNSFDGSMHVHKAGCRDLMKEVRRSSGEFDFTASTRESIIEVIWEDFIGEWDGDLSTGWENTKFFPCVSLPD